MITKVQWRKRIVFMLIIVAIAAGLFYGFQPQPLAVDLGVATRGPLRVSIEQEGRTRVVDRYVVSSPVAAYARRIELDVGDNVKRGDVLAYLDPPRAEVLDNRRRAEAEARVAAARANISAAEQRVHAARANAKLAQKELVRIRALRADHLVAVDAEDRAVTEAARAAAELRSAEFTVATTRHEMEAARTALQYSSAAATKEPITVHAPVDGRVLKIHHKSEGLVAAAQPLLEIGNANTLEVEIDVLSADAVRLHPGTAVEFERWGGEGVLTGRVRMVEPAGFTKVSALGVEEQRVWVIADFTSPIAQWQTLGDGYRVEARFILWQQDDVLQIPASALFRNGTGWAVFVAQQGQASKRAVQVGQRNGLNAQILSGIDEGERVIVHPDDRVHDGVRVAMPQS
jgi:HlyD family secretion protein